MCGGRRLVYTSTRTEFWRACSTCSKLWQSQVSQGWGSAAAAVKLSLAIYMCTAHMQWTSVEQVQELLMTKGSEALQPHLAGA